MSLIGSWMQMMVEGWLVYDITGSRAALGQIRFLHTLPVTIFSFMGGIVADRFSRKTILLSTQTVAMLSAFSLAAIAMWGEIAFWHLGFFSLLLGVAHAFDIPARQSLMAGLVGRKDLPNAIALNTSLFNGARCVGPALGGILLGVFGVVGCFFGNALSYLAVLASYLFIRFPDRAASVKKKDKGPFREAMDHLHSHPGMKVTLMIVAVVSLFVWPYSVLLPAFAKDLLHLDVNGLAILMASNGLGAFIGALCMTVLADKERKDLLIATGGIGLLLSLALFSFTSSLIPAVAYLFFTGWFMILFFSSCNMVVQINSPDELRGRLMSFYSFAFIGLTPFGSLLAGWVAEQTSIRVTLLSGLAISGITLCFAIPALSKHLKASPVHHLKVGD